MQFNLTKVIFKNIKAKNKDGKEFTVTGFYLEHEGVKSIKIKPDNNEDYKLLEALCDKKFSDYEPKVKDNSKDLLK